VTLKSRGGKEKISERYATKGRKWWYRERRPPIEAKTKGRLKGYVNCRNTKRECGSLGRSLCGMETVVQ
jgi:hypothetical protein